MFRGKQACMQPARGVSVCTGHCAVALVGDSNTTCLGRRACSV
jgi:hypothetical protein